MSAHTNLKHQAALTARAAHIDVLRADIRWYLDLLLQRQAQLDDLADTRQSVGLGFMTPEAKAARETDDRDARLAAHGYTTGSATGIGWMNPATPIASGVVQAPVTMPAVSVLAEIRYTLQHYVNYLARRANQQATAAGLCFWPRPGVDHATNVTDTELNHHLARLIGIYTKTEGLETILRDLTHLETKAADVIDGPAKTNHPHPCPWCNQQTLVIHHRESGRDSAVIRCEGTHACQCPDEWCECRRARAKHRHEWVNSGRATHTWSQLARDQANAQETNMAETKAQEAIARAAELHTPMVLQPWVFDCSSTATHENDWVVATGEEALICPTCPPVATVCGHCHTDTGETVDWPCATATALGLDQDTERTPA